MELLHRFDENIGAASLPPRFNNPFYYSPHPLCLAAANALRRRFSLDDALAAEVAKGKMFGVLVVADKAGEVGYLAAFSGLLFGKNLYDGFVPPVYDMLSPTGWFKQEEAAISAINVQIKEIEHDNGYLSAVEELASSLQAMERETSAMREAMRAGKVRRDGLRSKGQLTSDEEAQLVRESQFQKAELKRLVSRWQLQISACEKAVSLFKERIAALKEERKQRSATLQKWLFSQFKMLNARGEEKSLLDIFAERLHCLPPSGAGECAGPKLMQYAYSCGYRPVAMAEFWVGASPVGEVRRDGCFYGACKSKCEPILGYMLQGLDVEENILERGVPIKKIDVVYEDAYIVVVNKPSGVLSVPGVVGGISVEQWLRKEYIHSDHLYVVHRLDMSTSGLLVAAKSLDVYKLLQRQFAEREVEKQYVAILEGIPQCGEGVVELPLAPDYENRPCQKVDFVNGKHAVTRYRVVGTVEHEGRSCAVVCFEPVTGRTHQLRVHAASCQGLDSPIVGDALYGTVSDRLMLHASRLEFVHPVSGERVVIEQEAPFIKELL